MWNDGLQILDALAAAFETAAISHDVLICRGWSAFCLVRRLRDSRVLLRVRPADEPICKAEWKGSALYGKSLSAVLHGLLCTLIPGESAGTAPRRPLERQLVVELAALPPIMES